MARKIITNISTVQLNQTIDELHQYAQRLAERCEQFVSELADIGITTAKWNLFSIVNDTEGNMISYGDKVFFSKDVNFDTEGATAIIIPESQPYVSAWSTGIALVDPLLMAEFGSGMFAIEGHRGTFPEQKHAFDPNGWFWRDLNGQLHHSYGIEPTRPLFKAKEEMSNQIHEVAERVFEL